MHPVHRVGRAYRLSPLGIEVPRIGEVRGITKEDAVPENGLCQRKEGAVGKEFTLVLPW